MRTEKELGEALKREEDTITIEGDLVKKVIKIHGTGKPAWGLAIGAIGVAVVSVVATVATAGTSTPATGSCSAYFRRCGSNCFRCSYSSISSFNRSRCRRCRCFE